MLSVEHIKKFVDQNLKGSDKFLVDITISPDNQIHIFLDGDDKLTIQDCTDLHRYLESKLDRDEEDFELLVSSAGLDKGFEVKRQYIKNIGREVQVIITNGEMKTGKLLAVTEDGIELEILPPKNKKKRVKEQRSGNINLCFNDIKETKAVISFKKK